MKLETVRAVAQTLNKAGVKCLFAGGFAVAAHGYGRMTYDIDLVLNLFSDRHRETPIDIFVEEPFAFEKTYACACIEEIAPGVPVRFVDLETLIAMKERAGRPKDLDDIANLRAIQEDDVRGLAPGRTLPAPRTGSATGAAISSSICASSVRFRSPRRSGRSRS